MNGVTVPKRAIRVQVNRDFQSLPLSDDEWRMLAARGDTWTVFQEPAWQRAWWSVYGRGELMIATVLANDVPVLLAPLFIDCGMAFPVGSGGSDYLDFIGDVSFPGALEAVLDRVRQCVPDLLGLRMYHVPESSRTACFLERVAADADLTMFDEGAIAAPVLDLERTGKAGLQASRKKSLVRHERALQRAGRLRVSHLSRSADILPHLEAFFDQHIRRWRPTAHPSLFCNSDHRAFFRKVVELADDENWLRFSVVDLDGRPIAFHLGFSHRDVFLWYKPSFEIELAHLSPGEVLLRNLLIASVLEGSRVFDFGLGDEQFKQRFSSQVPLVRTWGLYPRR